jgi:hypothetical protein
VNEIDEELPQEYEQIPWSHLVPVQKDRSMQLALLVVVIVAALLAIVLFLRRSPEATPVAAPSPPSSVVVNPEQPTAVLSPTPPEPSAVESAVPQPQIYSEADLMAALPPRPELEAIARAEWFVTDFFTVDGDRSLADAVAATLPDAVALPMSDGQAISYVEWARAVAVSDNLDGSYEVTVWFRTLVGTAESGFSRTGVRAVAVRLVTDELGRLAIADIPIARSVEPPGIAPAWPTAASASPEVVAAAAADASVFGSDPELQTAGEDEDGWRLVFSVGDASGLRFPIAVRSPSIQGR